MQWAGFAPALKGRKIMTSGCARVSGQGESATFPRSSITGESCPDRPRLMATCKPSSFEAGRRAVEEAFDRRGVPCRVEQTDWAERAGCAIFEPVMPDDGPSVAILIPTRNHEYRLEEIAGFTGRNNLSKLSGLRHR